MSHSAQVTNTLLTTHEAAWFIILVNSVFLSVYMSLCQIITFDLRTHMFIMKIKSNTTNRDLP